MNQWDTLKLVIGLWLVFALLVCYWNHSAHRYDDDED